MEPKDFMSKKTNDGKNLINESEKTIEKKSDAEYFDVLDPKTGLRFDIPMLSRVDPGYFFKYIYFMKIRERSPDTFERILRWD